MKIVYFNKLAEWTLRIIKNKLIDLSVLLRNDKFLWIMEASRFLQSRESLKLFRAADK